MKTRELRNVTEEQFMEIADHMSGILIRDKNATVDSIVSGALEQLGYTVTANDRTRLEEYGATMFENVILKILRNKFAE